MAPMSSQPAAPPDARTANPILGNEFPIPFARVRADHVAQGIHTALADAQEALASVAACAAPYTWERVVAPLERAGERLSRAVAIVAHLNGVRQDADLRAAWSEVLPELSAFEARADSHPGIYRVLRTYAGGEEAAALPPERARHLALRIEEMRRAGAGLDDAARARAEAIQGELASLQNTFMNHVLDGVNAYALDVDDEGRLVGIPASACRRARVVAEAAGVDGWRFTLHQPSYVAVMDHARDRELRRELYEAQAQKGTGPGRDNRELIPRILRLRRELANLLGYDHWADLQTQARMAGNGRTAQAFERDLFARVEPHYRREIDELAAFAAAELGIDRLEPWDVRFAYERMREARFDLDQEALRPYLPLDRVQAGAFDLAEHLFGIRITSAPATEAWHPDVEYFEVHDADGTFIGAFYADWYPRDDKRGGAWMMPLVTGGPSPDGFAPHLGAIAGNLTPPEDGVALLTHSEAETVFHEFGHLLHLLLSRVEVRSRAGTAVAWDFIELPSQILENWLWEEASLTRIARRHDSGEPLPTDMLERMRAARTFGAAHHMARQLGYGTVDLALHIDFDPTSGEDPLAFGREVLAPFQIRPDAVSDGFLPAFSHIFAGGYAAGYYSYMWSEMLDADAFRRFRDGGLYDRATGEAFRRSVLSRGNGAAPDVLVREFLGREPDPEALLERNLGARART